MEIRWSMERGWIDEDKRKEKEKIECMDKNMKGQREDGIWRGRSDDEGQGRVEDERIEKS